MPKHISLDLSDLELRIIVGALNNVREFIEDDEFHAVMGVSKEELAPVLERLLRASDELG